MRLHSTKAAFKNMGVFVAVVVSVVFAFAMGAPAKAAFADEASEAPLVVKTFTDNDSGPFTDTWYNTTVLNAGNRGCSSCHNDMYFAMCTASTGAFDHVVGEPGMGKSYEYRDCTQCHLGAQINGFLAPNLAESLHAIHNSSAAFAENGTCMSCHAYDASGNFVLWDDIKYSLDVTGYADLGMGLQPEVTGQFEILGVQNGNVADVVIDHNFTLEDVTFDQPVSSNADGSEFIFTANNFGVPELSAEGYTVTVTGVQGKSEWTLDEIKALPVSEKLVTMDCGGQIQNSTLTSTFVAKGVLLSDFIEACGGLEEGMVSVGFQCGDNWPGFFFMQNLDVATLLDHDSILAWEYNGHELTAKQGYPLTMVNPAMPGLASPKYLTGLNFNAEFGMPTTWNEASGSPASIDSGWLGVEDGFEVHVGETVALNGWAYDHATVGHDLAAVAFSADYGFTWNYVDVPADHDRDAWVNFHGTWTPQLPGTYVLKVRAIDNIDDGTFTYTGLDGRSYTEASVIVKVVE